MSYYTMAFVGSSPFGSLLAGVLAHRIGAPHTVIITGSFCLAGAAWFSLRVHRVESAMHDNHPPQGLEERA
jgi:hypothetical protein